MATYKDHVLNECWRIAALASALAQAAERRFTVDTDHPDFEDCEGAECAEALRVLRYRLEDLTASAVHADSALYDAFHAYHRRVVRMQLQTNQHVKAIN